ncbi:MAG TPA: tetratricopeptide repeat protein [Polyangiaceae bacterium]|nr:tetratricopeptide repeat protein [Polyangiaceae bacterium]
MEFPTYAAQPDDALDLLEGALLIAADAHPGLDRSAVRQQLDELAAPLLALGVSHLPPRAQARALSDQLFVRAGFQGNSVDYYDPRNSFLDQVLARRTGIPITLAVVYLEVARRAGVAASPVGFPGHFLVCLDARGERLAIDPFSGGAVLDDRGLVALLRRSGSRLSYAPELIAPTPVRQVLARMLLNLRAIYAQRGDLSRLLVIFDHLIDLLPNAADERRDRGLLFGRLGAPDAALADLERYLELAPEAPDADQIRQWMQQMRQASAAGSVRS